MVEGSEELCVHLEDLVLERGARLRDVNNDLSRLAVFDGSCEMSSRLS